MNSIPSELGAQAELAVASALTRAGRQVYLVPVADAPSRGCYLRLSSPRNGQAKGIRWADDYLLNGE